jgi:hypothetical protein
MIAAVGIAHHVDRSTPLALHCSVGTPSYQRLLAPACLEQWRVRSSVLRGLIRR